MKRHIVFSLLVAFLALGAWNASVPQERGVFVVLLLITVIGRAIAWLSGASTRLSSSGREMRDGVDGNYSDYGAPHGH
jgi:hypothetical protein